MSIVGESRSAALYLRQSKGNPRSIEEQDSAGHADCEANGWPVAGIYQDTTSASRFARTARADWERLLSDLEDGAFGVLWLWESSRGDRDAETWLGLLRRCREGGVWIHVSSHERTYDMGNHRDWRTLADEGVDSAYESEKTSARVRRDLGTAAVKGLPHGPTMYGYERIYNPKTRELEEQRPHTDQAPVVREIVSRVAQGDPVSCIVADLNERGLPAPKGGQWGRTTIRSIATNAAYLGKRRSGVRAKREPDLYNAIWPAIVTEDDFNAARRRLGDPARKTTRPGRARWLVSYIAQCDECSAPMAAHRQATCYRCTGRLCTSIRREWLDFYVSELVIAWVQREEMLRDLMNSGDSAVIQARAEAARLRFRLDEHARMSARGDIAARQYMIIEQELAPLIAAADKRAQQAGLPPALRSLASAREAIPELWEGLPVAAKREAIAAIMSIRVKRAPHRGPGSISELKARVAIDWAHPQREQRR